MSFFSRLLGGRGSGKSSPPPPPSPSPPALAAADTATWTFPEAPIRSSNLASVAFDFESQLLDVRFVNGGLYRYFDVPLVVYRDLIDASSPGRFHHRFIKDRYRFEKRS